MSNISFSASASTGLSELFYQFEMLFMVDNTDLLAKMSMLTLILILILILTLLVTDGMVDVDIERQ